MLAFSLRAIPLKNGRGGVFVFEKKNDLPLSKSLFRG